MSAFASVPTSMNDARSVQISLLPNVSMIFGQLLVARQRSSMPDGSRPRGADAKDERILHGVLQLVQQRGIEAVLQADVRRIRRPGKRRLLARRERPVRGGNLHHPALDARSALRYG